jgi:autotransporter-associated beta strand protein
VLAIAGNSDTVGAVSLKNGGSITGSGGTLTGASYAVESGSVSAKLGGAGIALTKSTAGTVTLTGINTYTGATTISGGTLALGANGSIISPDIIVGANTTFNVSGVTGGYTLGATQTLSGTGSVVGATVVVGTLSPGNSIGTMNFSNTLSLAGISNFEIDPLLGLGLNADRANVTNGVTYGGTLNVLYSGSNSNFTNGMIFNLFDGSSFSGSFTAVNLPSLDGTGLSWQNDLLSNGSLTIIPEPNVAALIGALGGIMLLRRRR